MWGGERNPPFFISLKDMGITSSVTLNGKAVSVSKDFFDVGVKASFGEEIQANLTTEEFTFILDAYEEIRAWIQGGLTGDVGIFEGIPISITTGNTSVFDGILDLQDSAIIRENLKQIQTRLRQNDSLNQLDQLLEPLDYGYLKDLGVITASDYVDVDYVVAKIDNGIETITTFITIYLLSKQLADTIKEIGTVTATISGITASGITGGIGAAIYAVAVAILQVAYAATLLILIIDFGIDLFNILVQPQRTHKAIPLRTLLSKACQYIGYSFETSITDLNNLVYLPSNQNVDEFGEKGVFTKVATITEGIPNAADIGYTCPELFQICRNAFNGRFAIVGSTVQFHTESSPYWITESGWVKPTIQREVAQASYRRNTDELKASIFIKFATDLVDEYTIQNYTGTAFQVLTDAKAINNPTNKTIKNLDRVDIPFALGNRKDSLTAFENSLLPLANLFDDIAGIFGGKPNLAKKIKNKVGVLKVSNNNHSVPKLLWIEGGRIPTNNRDLLSARTFWDKYQSEKSFVQNNFSRQRRIIENEIVPFGLSDFVTLLGNSYFKDENGTQGKITDIEWIMAKDFATISYWLEEVYTNNLQETFIEP